MNDLAFQDYFAEEILATAEEQGKEVVWPAVDDYGKYTGPNHGFDSDVWEDAGARVAELSDDERKTISDTAERQYYEMLSKFKSVVRMEAFKSSFGVIDIVFFVIAIGAAWGIASRDET
ncbi:MAG: hypothetical protein R3C03_18075 [Pirellulaceae bacterium]